MTAVSSYGLLILAIVLIIVVLFWPGYASARAGDATGFWVSLNSASDKGSMYEIRPVTTGRQKGVIVLNSAGDTKGHFEWLRTIRLEDGKKGRLAIDGRAISWDDGDEWVRQGH